MNPRTPICWPLLVVSSEGQREDLDDHLAVAQADAERNGWRLDRIEDFRDVATGKRGVRDPLVKLVAELKATPSADLPAWIWMRRVDRAGRGPATESTLALQMIRATGVRIWDHDRGEVDPGTAAGELVTMLLAWNARVDGETRAGKAKVVHQRRRDRGLPIGFRRPYGLMLDADGRDVPCEPQADAVRLAYRLRLEGMTLYKIAERLNDVAPPARYKDHEHVVRWQHSRVRRLLRNRAYRGVLVDEVAWQGAQKAGVERPPRKHPWPLAGCLVCYCGTAMFGDLTRDGKSGRPYRYYRCHARWNHAGAIRLARAEPLEAGVAARIAHLHAHPTLLARAVRAGTTAAELTMLERAVAGVARELADLERKRANLLDAVADGTLRGPTAQPRIDALDAERVALLEREASVGADLARARRDREGVADVAAIVAQAARLYARSKPARQNELVRLLCARLGRIVAAEDGSIRIGQSPAARRSLP